MAIPHPHPHPAGTRLGQFEVISYSIPSDVSIDYVCLDHENSCPVLLKTLRPELQPSRRTRDRFAQSGAAWVGLGAHPHIVRCYSVLKLENSDEAFLVLQAVVAERERSSAHLLSWLSLGQSLPVLQALLFALQIARGMRYVADKIPGFVHGDLKPESILVGGGRLSQADVNRLRLTDFGLAGMLQAHDVDLPQSLGIDETAVARTQLINGVVGTPLYMSPEQWRGESAGTASDVYALGCLLYKMLVGRHPVAGKTAQALRNAHCTGNVRPFSSTLPYAAIDLATRCLALEPGERYQSWQEVETAIAIAYEGATKYPVPAAEPSDAPTESERVLEGWAFNTMGAVCSEAGNVNTAVVCLKLAVKAGDAMGDRALVGAATNNLGETYFKRGDPQQAIECHQKALTIAVETGDRSSKGAALNNLGSAYLQLGNPRQAIPYLEQALAVAREIGDRRGELAGLTNLGSAYHQLGDLSRAMEYHEQELKISRKIGDPRGESAALSNLGAVFSDLGEYGRAIGYYEQSLAIKSRIGERFSQIATLTNLGSAYRGLGNAQRAFECYTPALEIAREMGDRRGEAFALNGMGSTYTDMGKLEQALAHLEQALEIFRAIGDKQSQGTCLTNLGEVYMSRHDLVRAKECCEQALAIDREVGDVLGLALDSFNMANILVEEGRFREALPYAEESASILEKIGHRGKAPGARQLVVMIRAELGRQTSRGPEVMRTYHNEELGFAIDVPKEWPRPTMIAPDSLVFDRTAIETLNFVVGVRLPERLLEYTEFEFKQYVQSQGYTDVDFGRISVGGKDHLWARYRMGNKAWAKKYMIMFGGMEYAITASCFGRERFMEKERTWNQIVRSFRLSKSAKQNADALDAERSKVAGEKYQRAYKLSAQGRYQEARALLEEILRDDPDHILAHKELAFLLKTIGDVSGAIPHRQAVKRLDPSDTVNRFNLAGLYTVLGAKDEALREVEELLIMDPSNSRFLELRRLLVGSPLTYPQHYTEESQQQPGERRNLKLVDSVVPDFPYLTHLLLLYRWDELLPDQEARRLAQRAVAYISCAIYDATISAGLACQPFPIPNGRRPAWIFEGERSPVSLILSDIDESERTCQMTIGAMMTLVGESPSDRTRWQRLQAAFKAKFSDIWV